MEGSKGGNQVARMGHREPCQSPSGPLSQEISIETGRATMGSTVEWSLTDETPMNDRLSEGYDYEFLPQPDKKYDCAICLQVLREPLQTQCGHRFCKSCIYRWLNHMNEVGPKCPVCTEQINPQQLFEDKFAHREILQFRVRCPNSRYGCSMELELKQVKDHRQRCLYEQLACPQGCDKIVTRRHVDIHLEQECTQRLATCRWCQVQVHYYQKEAHETNCGDILVPCKTCQRPLQRKQMAEHTAVGCEKDVKPCIFAQLGCENKNMPLKEITDHNERCTQYHLQLLANTINQILVQMGLPGKLTQVEPGRTQLELTVRNLHIQENHIQTPALARENSHDFPAERQTPNSAWQGHFPLNKGSSNSLETLLKGSSVPTHPRSAGNPRYANVPPPYPPQFTSNRDDSSFSFEKDSFSKHNTIDRIPSTPDPITEVHDLTERSKNQDSRLALQEQQILELRAKVSKLETCFKEHEPLSVPQYDPSVLEPRLCNGVYIWKIHNFTQQREEAARSPSNTAVLHSNGFYTSFYGYKLCLRVNLNGVEGGSGTHVSVFIHFMQGEFDDLLEWPFKGRITLSILDQGHEKIHITETLEPKPGLAAFQRPHSKRNHKGFGYIEFAPLRLLENSNFLVHDTLIVKAEVTEQANNLSNS